MVKINELANKPFLVQVILKQVVDGNNTLVVKDGEEFAYGKDIMPTMANLFMSTKMFVEKKLKIETPKAVVLEK